MVVEYGFDIENKVSVVVVYNLYVCNCSIIRKFLELFGIYGLVLVIGISRS